MYAVLNSKAFLVLVAMSPLELCSLSNNCYVKHPFSSSPGLDGILFIFRTFLKKSVFISVARLYVLPVREVPLIIEACMIAISVVDLTAFKF